MFIKKTRSKNYVYLTLVETYRQDGKVRHRTLAKLGRLDKFKDASMLQKLESLPLGNNTKLSTSTKLKEMERCNWGAAIICRKLWNLYRLDDIFHQISNESRIRFDVAKVVFLEVVSRIFDPCSKLRLFERQSNYFGLEPVKLHHLYRALDFLAKHKDKIEQHLFQVGTSDLKLSVDVIFYDVTTLYFESVEAGELREFGYSKDCKFGEVQVVVGLLVTSDGRPISCNVYPGNTFETKTMEETLSSLKNKFNVRQVIIVADRGLNSKLNFQSIRDAGYDYIVGSRLRRMSKSMQEKVLDIDKYTLLSRKEDDVIRYYHFDYDNVVTTKTEEGQKQVYTLKEKLHCFWSLSRAKKDQKDRNRLLEKAKDMVSGQKSVGSKRGAKRYILTGSNEEQKATTINTNQIIEDEKWDGFYGIHSSRLDLSPAEVKSAYHNLWKIEESFRILKSSLETRPMFHWNDQRIRGHICLCFLSFLLLRTMEILHHEHELEFSPQKFRDAINSMEFSRVQTDNIEYSLTSPLSETGSTLLEVLGIPQPEPFSPIKNFQKYLGYLAHSVNT